MKSRGAATALQQDARPGGSFDSDDSSDDDNFFDLNQREASPAKPVVINTSVATSVSSY